MTCPVVARNPPGGKKADDGSVAKSNGVKWSGSAQEWALEVELERGNGARSSGEGRPQVVEQLKERLGGIGCGRRPLAAEAGTDPHLAPPEALPEAVASLHGERQADLLPGGLAAPAPPHTTKELPQGGGRYHMTDEKAGKEHGVRPAAPSSSISVTAEETPSPNDLFVAALSVSA